MFTHARITLPMYNACLLACLGMAIYVTVHILCMHVCMMMMTGDVCMHVGYKRIFH